MSPILFEAVEDVTKLALIVAGLYIAARLYVRRRQPGWMQPLDRRRVGILCMLALGAVAINVTEDVLGGESGPIDKANLATGASSALQLSSLATARKAMRLQKGLDGTTPIDATPKFLIVPAALELTAEQLLTQITPAVVGEVNPFAGKLDLIVEPRLDAVSATAWYLAADPALLDTIEYAYLDGEVGPQIFIEQGFEIDGMSMKCREDFGAGVLDWRGLYKAAGA
jgi:hypothetical protein